jgi:hypothetical protein
METGGTRETGLQGGLSFVTFLWPPKKSKERIKYMGAKIVSVVPLSQ